jgi:hypothetical protein
MAGEEKRRSERVVPVVNDEEVVVVHAGGQPALGKMLDLSDGGTLVYLFFGDREHSFQVGSTCKLALSHGNKVVEIPARVARVTGRLLGFEFVSPDVDAARLLNEKLIRMEVEWMRISRRV